MTAFSKFASTIAIAMLFATPATSGDAGLDGQMITTLRKMYPTMRPQTYATVDDEASFDVPGKRIACTFAIKSGSDTVSFSNCHVIRGAKP